MKGASKVDTSPFFSFRLCNNFIRNGLSLFFSLSVFLLIPGFTNLVYADIEEGEIKDPIEPFNRSMFWFNDQVDQYLLEPVAKGYDKAIPEVVQDGVGNFFENIRFPQYFVSDLVQLKFGRALHHSGRFLINSTMGLLGLIDVADRLGLERQNTDFGTALGYHDLPTGPYIVWPFLGPSNVRDTFGQIVDIALNPFYWIGSVDGIESRDKVIISTSATLLDVVHKRSRMIDQIKAAKESSLDYYLFVQGAYYQYRKGLVKGENLNSMYEKGSKDTTTEVDDNWDDDDL